MNAAALMAAPMELGIAGLGTFPPKGPPRVVWAGVTGEVEPLGKLVDALENGLAETVRVAPETRAYHPHLTLGRVRSSRGAERLARAIEEAGPVNVGGFTADELVLFMSELTREGPVHTPMAHAPFAK